MAGKFEQFGGRHVPEPLEEPLAQLAEAFETVVPPRSSKLSSTTT
jgi:tryptophan synthase beta chain